MLSLPALSITVQTKFWVLPKKINEWPNFGLAKMFVCIHPQVREEDY